MMIEKSGTIRLRDIPTTTRLTQEEQDLLLPLLQKHANALKAAVEKIHRPKDAH